MGRLKTELEKKFSLVPKDERPLVFNPKNCAEVTSGLLYVSSVSCLFCISFRFFFFFFSLGLLVSACLSVHFCVVCVSVFVLCASSFPV